MDFNYLETLIIFLPCFHSSSLATIVSLFPDDNLKIQAMELIVKHQKWYGPVDLFIPKVMDTIYNNGLKIKVLELLLPRMTFSLLNESANKIFFKIPCNDQPKAIEIMVIYMTDEEYEKFRSRKSIRLAIRNRAVTRWNEIINNPLVDDAVRIELYDYFNRSIRNNEVNDLTRPFLLF